MTYGCSKNTVSTILILIIGLMLVSPVRSDDPTPMVELETFKLAEAEKSIEMPRIKGNWVAFYDGRDGRRVYDLDKRQQHDHIEQWRNIPFDISDTFMVDAERQNMSVYSFQRKERSRWGTRFEDVAEMHVGSRWAVLALQEYNHEFRMKLTNLVVLNPGNGRGQRTIREGVAMASLAMEGSVIAWSDFRFDQAGVFMLNMDERRPSPVQLSEATDGTLVDTDGQSIIWKAEGVVRRYTVATEVNDIIFFADQARNIFRMKIEGDWLVYQSDARSIRARHLPSGKDIAVTSPTRHEGINNLVGISGGNVLFTRDKELWISRLPDQSD